ncbi:MAG: HAMP domain-containing sensor histidine kinase [Acidimicrobiia bacterium]|nr:HAMP domain-containing sensor histidine kinase [Acidimicrobiia bacterium]
MSVIDRAHRLVLFLMATAIPTVFLVDLVVEAAAGELSMAPGTEIYFTISAIAGFQIITKRWSADWIIVTAGAGTAILAFLRYSGRDTLMDLNTASVLVPILGLAAIAISRRGQLVIGGSLGVTAVVLTALTLQEAQADSDVVITSTVAVTIAFVLGGVLLHQLRTAYEEQYAARDRFVASVSHELRNPLTGLLGFAELLSDEGQDAEIVGLIRSQAYEAVDIVEDLLVAARVDAGQVTLMVSATDLQREVESVISSQGRADRTDEKSIESVLGPIQVDADPLRLRQIVRNLLTNAIRHGGNHISVRTLSADGHGHVEVSDDGGGFDLDDAEAIFAPYGRAKRTNLATGSIGLGLTVSRELARLMGGDLMAIRDEGFTTFRLSLPLSPAPLPSSTAPIEA